MSGIGIDSVGEEDRDHMHLRSDPSTASNALRIGAEGQRYKQTTSLCTLVVLAARARTSTPGLSVVSSPLGRVSEDTVLICTIDGTPDLSLKIRLFKAELVEAMLFGCATWIICALRALAASVSPTTNKLLLCVIRSWHKDRTG